jgi:hypothetical protein
MAKADFYSSYVESIAPGAYQAYETCKKLEGNNITFSVSQAAILPKALSLTVGYNANVAGASQTLRFTAAPGTSCSWEGLPPVPGNAQNVVVPTLQSVGLDCTRKDDTARSYVRVFSLSMPATVLDLPWSAFQSGQPADVVQDLRDEVAAARKEVATVRGDVTRNAQASAAAVAAVDGKLSDYTLHKYTITGPYTAVGNATTPLRLTAAQGICFLTSFQGKYGGYGEGADVVVDGGNWVLKTKQGAGGADIRATAQCLKFE